MMMKDEFEQQNFQFYDNERSSMLTFLSKQKYDEGKTILLNRQHEINIKIDKHV